MSLKRADLNGNLVSITVAPFPKSYWAFVESLPKAKREEVYLYVRDSIKIEKQFTVATKFGNVNLTWQEIPLVYLLDAAKGNEEVAGYLLGLIVMAVLIADESHWNTVKTIIGRRDFATNFYWRAA